MTSYVRLLGRKLVALLVPTLLTGMGVSALAATAVSSRISLTAVADAGNGQVTDTASIGQGATLNALGPVNVTAASTFGDASVASFQTVSASWSSASAGQVNFDDVGFIAQNIYSGLAQSTLGPDWEYVFIASETGRLVMDYSVTMDSRTSDPFGLVGIYAHWSGDNSYEMMGLDTSGVYSRDVIAGQQYSFSLSDHTNLSGGLGTRSAMMDGRFNWRLESMQVSEPASLALFGLALVALATRCRRSL